MNASNLTRAIALALGLAVQTSHAGVGHPYRCDSHTLVLYHFDEVKGEIAGGKPIMNYGLLGGYFGTTNTLNLTNTGGLTGRGGYTAGGYTASPLTGFAASFGPTDAGDSTYHDAVASTGIDLADGLKLYYPMDGAGGSTVTDTASAYASGTVANKGSKIGNPRPALVAGRFGDALLFTQAGANSVGIDVTSPGAAADLNVGTQLTLSAWVQLPLAPASYPRTSPNGSIFNSSVDAYVIYIESSAGQLIFKTRTANGSTLAHTDSTNNGIKANQWFNVVGTYDGRGASGVTKLYINGVQVFSQTGGDGGTTQSGALLTQAPKIGFDSTGLNGKVDDVAIWNRVLSASEIGYIGSGHPVSQTVADNTTGGGALTATGVAQSALQASSGAFTYEALIKVSTLGDATTVTKQVIVSHDGDSAASANSRGPQLMIQNSSAGPKLAFFNGNGGSGASTIAAAIPTTGTNAFDSSAWYHVAVTFTGSLGTANNVKLYWTKVAPAVTAASLLGQGTLSTSQGVAASTVANPRDGGGNLLGIGGDSRGVQRFELQGFIDEVRISDTARAATDFVFHP